LEIKMLMHRYYFKGGTEGGLETGLFVLS